MPDVKVELPGLTLTNESGQQVAYLRDLRNWHDGVDVKRDSEQRENGVGVFRDDDPDTGARFPIVYGALRSLVPGSEWELRARVLALQSLDSFELRVTDPTGIWRAEVVVSGRIVFTVHDDGWADFEIPLEASDPRLYGPLQTLSTGVPSPGVGLADPVLDPLQVGEVVEVARNLDVNPRKKGNGAWLEVRRNLTANPLIVGTDGFTTNRCAAVAPGGGVLEATVTEVGYFPRYGATASHFVVTAGNVVTLSADIEAGSVPVRARFAFFSDAAATAQVGPAIETPMTATGRMKQTATAPAGAIRCRVEIGIADNTPIGTVFRISKPLVEVNSTNPYSWFDPTAPFGAVDPDMRQRFVGVVNRSESVMEAERIAGVDVVAAQRLDYTCTDSPPEGVESFGRFQLATASAIGIPAVGQAIIALGQVGTLVMWARSSRTITAVPRHRGTMLPSTRVTLPAGEWVPVRITAPAGDSGHQQTGLLLDGSSGHHVGDRVDVALSTYVAGTYDGPVFYGGTPGDGTRMYMWAGAPDNSESIAVIVDASDQGNPARVPLTNTGTAPSEPVVKIYGGMTEGFELLCIEQGRTVRCTRPIPEGSFVSVDHGTGELWIDDQSPLPSTYIPVAEWFQIAPGETCTIQWTPLGVVTGEPRMVVEGASASW